jgi:U3 small nucleolar RNA-associated protein 14
MPVAKGGGYSEPDDEYRRKTKMAAGSENTQLAAFNTFIRPRAFLLW